MSDADVLYEARLKHDIARLAVVADFGLGLVAVPLTFLLDVPFAALIIAPTLWLNALFFWLVYPRALQLTAAGLRVKTGGLAGGSVPLDAVAAVAVVEDVVHLKGADGRYLLKPVALAEAEEFAARVNAAIGRGRRAA